MRAFRLVDWGCATVLTDVDRPEPRGDEVLVRVLAAGLCHSDLHVLDAGSGALALAPPFTLGHEIAGEVVAGPGLAAGMRVVVYGPWGCGACGRCSTGYEQHCDRRDELPGAGAGLGRDGGMADFLLVPSARHLEPIGDLDPVEAAPLTDAGLTAYHAIQQCRPLGAGSTVAVIGVGGLGHVAVQLLRVLTPAAVFAVDVRSEALELAERCGASLVTRPAADTDRMLRQASGGRGVDAVLDFVGSDATLDLGVRSLRAGGDFVLVGSGGGRLMVRKPGTLPPGCRISVPFWGARAELAEVVALARAGALRVEVERFPLSAAPEAVTRLRTGGVKGRAVLIP